MHVSPSGANDETMALINWLKKRFGLEGMTGAKLVSYSGFALFLWFMFGVFERLRDFLLDILLPLAPPALQSIGKAILTVLFYPINANVLTILVGILVFIPVYHYAIRRFYKSKPSGQIIFLDNFNATSRFNWSAPLLGWQCIYRPTNQGLLCISRLNRVSGQK